MVLPFKAQPQASLLLKGTPLRLAAGTCWCAQRTTINSSDAPSRQLRPAPSPQPFCVELHIVDNAPKIYAAPGFWVSGGRINAFAESGASDQRVAPGIDDRMHSSFS
jgi:hypothetical protein